MGTEGFITVGTAGHIDHGKTWLVRALTGIDTDRLKEEKERGISIELGFAPLELPSGRTFGLIDVPGHERFIRQMLAGAAGIDLALLVIASDEGVMPQTLEHLAILDLLRVQRGLVVLTKKDLVEPDWLEMVTEDVRAALKGSFLEDAPILAVSAKTHEGLDRLTWALEALAAKATAKDASGPVRLPIDRVFSIKGVGTVVTGTLWSGTLETGAELLVLPKGVKSKVRGLEVHGKKLKEAFAGQRVAVNLANIETQELKRGDALVSPGAFFADTRLDAQLELLEQAKPLKQRQRVRLHLGTAEALCRVVLLEDQTLRPGNKGLVRLLLESPVVAAPNDRFVIRMYSPMVTIGGGEVIQLGGNLGRVRRAELAERLKKRLKGSLEDWIGSVLEAPLLLSEESIQQRLALPPGQESRILPCLEALLKQGKVRAFKLDSKRLWMGEAAFERLKGGMVELLKAFHKEYPLRGGLSREAIREKMAKGIEPKGFGLLLEAMAKEGSLCLKGELVALQGFTPRLSERLTKAKEAILKRFISAKFNPPDWEEAVLGVGLELSEGSELLAYLLEQGDLIRLKEGLLLPAGMIDSAKRTIRDLIHQKGPLGIGDVRDALNSSRKLVIPLLEHLDKERFTRRMGDKRLLWEETASGQTPNLNL